MPHTHAPRNEPLPGIAHIIAVGSGKGGVGKSTVAVNVAVAMAQEGYRVGLVDTDVLGPSVPGMLGLTFGEEPRATPDGRLMPNNAHGIAMVSMGLLRSDDEPAIMRGPMVTKYLQMFLAQVAWGELDYLVLDLPPGTGDTQLTLAQSVQLSGAVVVTTPQDVSLKIARRGLRMFETVSVPILGIIENMGPFHCPHCGQSTDVFSHGGGERMSRELNVPFLGSIPLDPTVVTSTDAGSPLVVDAPDSVCAAAYREIARTLVNEVAGTTQVGLRPFQWDWSSGEGAPEWHEDAAAPSDVPVGMCARDDSTLRIAYGDGTQDDLDVRELRLSCPCAQCVEEMSGQALLDPDTVPIHIMPRRLTSVGTYGIIIDWSDGHGTGIYTYRQLRRLAERFRARNVEDV